MNQTSPIRFPWIVILGISLSFFLASYDTTAFNLALVSIQNDLQLSLSQLDWVMTSMMIALGTFLVPGGKISDKYGHKYPMIIGLITFSLVSVLGGFAQNAPQLISMRILEGATAALFWPGMQAISLYAVKESKRTLAVGVSQFAGALGIATGPLLSGILLNYLSWRWVFWTTVPVALLSLVIIAIFIPDKAFEQHKKKKIDLASVFFLCGAAFSLIHALDLLGRYGFVNQQSLTWCAISVVLFWFFIVRDDNIREPLIDFEILKNKQFVSGVLVRIMAATSYFSFLFLTGFALQQIALLSAEESSFYFLPLTIGLMIFSLIAGWLGRYFSVKNLMFIGLFGLGVACLSYGILLQFSLDYWVLTTPLALMGIFFGIMGPTNTVFTIGSLPKSLTATGAGVLTMLLMIFGSVGIVIASIFIRFFGTRLTLSSLKTSEISLSSVQESLVEQTITGMIPIKQAMVRFGEHAEAVYLALRKSFFQAMGLDLYLLAGMIFLTFAILVPLHYKKVKSQL